MRLCRFLAPFLLLGCEAAQPERDPSITALQVELLDRASRDQAVRDSAFGRAGGLDTTAVAAMERVDRENTEWLKGQVSAHGWPSRAKVGERAAQAAFLIVQHATHDPAFQQEMLDTLTRGWKAGEVDGESYAMLFDRVQAQAGRRQRYGTQAKLVGTTVVFDPIEDTLRVDSLRRTVGLGTLAEYRRLLDSLYLGPTGVVPGKK